MSVIHVIQQFNFAKPSRLIGGSANILLGKVQNNGFGEENILISRFENDLPENFFTRCINVNCRTSGRLGSVEFLIRVTWMLFFNKIESKASQLHYHFGIYENLALITLVNWILLPRYKISISLYCPPKPSWLNKMTVRALNVFPFTEIWVLSKNIANCLSSLGVVRNLRYIGPILAPMKFPKKEDSQAPEPLKDILFIGNIKPEKGIELLVSALLATQHPVSVTFTTEKIPSDKFSYVQSLKNSLSENPMISFEFCEIVDDISRLYKSHKVIVFPWLSTTGPSDYPVALLEASLYGMLVLTFKWPAIFELQAIFEGIIACELDELAESLESLLSKPPQGRLERMAHNISAMCG